MFLQGRYGKTTDYKEECQKTIRESDHGIVLNELDETKTIGVDEVMQAEYEKIIHMKTYETW